MFFPLFLYIVSLFGDPLTHESDKNKNKQNHLGDVSSSFQSTP